MSTYRLPSDFPAPEYLRTGDFRHWPFTSVPYRHKWKLRHRIAYALHLRWSYNNARDTWGAEFARVYWRVCACIAVRLSCPWQEKKYGEVTKRGDFNAWLERNRRKLGYR